MSKLFVKIFAVIGFIFVSLMIVSWGIALSVHYKTTQEPASVILNIDLSQPISEHGEASALEMALGGRTIALIDVLHAISRAGKDPHVKGIVARFGASAPSLAHAQEIRNAIKKIRESGKLTYAYGEEYGSFGLGNRSYYLASAFEHIWMQPTGAVSLTGVAMLSPFAKSALDKLGVVADYMQREEYKSFMEMGQRDGFSAPVKDEMQKMADGLADQIAQGISSSRKWEITKVKDLMLRGPYTDEEALQEGLVSRLAYLDELEDEIKSKFGRDVQIVDTQAYLNYRNVSDDQEKRTHIALIIGSGLIMSSSPDSGIIGERIMSAADVVDAFNSAIEDEKIKAILFRVDSSGGAPTASESIRRAVVRAQKKGKPVIVSLGETAASGGYWIAMNGDKVLASPATITGSIGVISGKFAANGILQKLGVSIDGVSTAENAGMWNPYAPFTPAQRSRVNALLDSSYNAFIDRASVARKIPKDKMLEIAKGRVWTGEQALKIGLIDELGGYDEAKSAIRKELKLDPSSGLLIKSFPEQKSTADKFIKFIKSVGLDKTEAVLPRHLKSFLRNAFWPLWSGVSDMPVAAVLPVAEYMVD